MGSSSGSSEGDSMDEKKGKMYSKDMRVSCEAIPEEIAGKDIKYLLVLVCVKLFISGTSPPQSETVQAGTSSAFTHPSLLSYHSFPGSSLPNESNIVPKLYQTVPPSPAVHSGGTMQLEFPNRPTALPSSIGGLQPLAGKPPQSPTQTSPRLARHITKGSVIFFENNCIKDKFR